VTSGGIGLATDVALLATKWKAAGGWRARVARRLGPAVYVLGTVWEALLPRNPIDLSVDLDGRARRALVSMLIVSNQPRIGGRFAPSPDASNHDGLLDVCLVNAPRSRLRLLWVCFQIFLGRPDRCREITRERGRRLRIEATQALTFFGDGEVLARSRRLSIDTLEGALRVATTRPRARHAEEVTHA
jgi:diacylglycerol kinase family enzyme